MQYVSVFSVVSGVPITQEVARSRGYGFLYSFPLRRADGSFSNLSLLTFPVGKSWTDSIFHDFGDCDVFSKQSVAHYVPEDMDADRREQLWLGV